MTVDLAAARTGMPQRPPGGDTVVSGAPGGWEPSRDLPELHQAIGHTLGRLRAKAGVIATCWAYYDGNHPQLWMTEKLRQVFGPKFEGSLQDNYCPLVVDSVVNRLQVTGWAATAAEADPAGDAGDDTPGQLEAGPDVARALELFEANDLDLEQEELYRASRVAGEAFVIVWPRYDANGEPVRGPSGQQLYDIVVNDARLVHLEEGTNRRRRLWACKVWLDRVPDGMAWRANLYYDDELVRLRTATIRNGSRELPAKADRFLLDTEDPGGPNPMGTVPVFRFARDRRGRSALAPVIPVQDKINKLAANKMVAAEFLAWRQRYILSAGDIPDEKLRPSPGSVLVLDPGGETEDGKVPPTQVGEFEATDLSNIDKAKAEELVTLFTLARLPRHLMVNPGTPPSGDAIKADEGPHIADVEDHQQMYGASWRDVMAACGISVAPTWADPVVVNEEAMARTVQALWTAGVPVDVALQQVAHWPADVIRRVTDAVTAAQERQAQADRLASRMLDTGLSGPGMLDAGELGG